MELVRLVQPELWWNAKRYGQTCREQQKKKEAARRANACATGGDPAPVCNLRPWESAVSIQR